MNSDFSPSVTKLILAWLYLSLLVWTIFTINFLCETIGLVNQSVRIFILVAFEVLILVRLIRHYQTAAIQKPNQDNWRTFATYAGFLLLWRLISKSDAAGYGIYVLAVATLVAPWTLFLPSPTRKA